MESTWNYRISLELLESYGIVGIPFGIRRNKGIAGRIRGIRGFNVRNLGINWNYAVIPNHVDHNPEWRTPRARPKRMVPICCRIEVVIVWSLPVYRPCEVANTQDD